MIILSGVVPKSEVDFTLTDLSPRTTVCSMLVKVQLNERPLLKSKIAVWWVIRKSEVLVWTFQFHCSVREWTIYFCSPFPVSFTIRRVWEEVLIIRKLRIMGEDIRIQFLNGFGSKILTNLVLTIGHQRSLSFQWECALFSLPLHLILRKW